MKKTRIVLLSLLIAAAMITAGCGDGMDPETGAGEDATYTESGYEYRAYTDEDSGRASVKYLDAVVDIDEAEFVRDSFDDQVYLVLRMMFKNDSSIYRPEGDEDSTFYMDSLHKAFVIQALQNGNVIEHRGEAEAESFEESNCWELIDSGKSLDCKMYFPVEPDSPVTIQVLNPDGEDTVMAELTYTPPDDPEDIEEDF